MKGLIDIAAEVMANHGWRTRGRADLTNAGPGFDLVAENDAAIVFFTLVEGSRLRARVEILAGTIGAITLRRGAEVKAWEAYLVLILEDEVGEATTREAQHAQQDLNYCRKIVLDGYGIAATENPLSTMERFLSFLFPLDAVTEPGVGDVRGRLIDLMEEKGFERGLVTQLAAAFDREPECQCWERVREASLEGGPA